MLKQQWKIFQTVNSENIASVSVNILLIINFTIVNDFRRGKVNSYQNKKALLHCLNYSFSPHKPFLIPSVCRSVCYFFIQILFSVPLLSALWAKWHWLGSNSPGTVQVVSAGKMGSLTHAKSGRFAQALYLTARWLCPQGFLQGKISAAGDSIKNLKPLQLFVNFYPQSNCIHWFIGVNLFLG